MRRIYPYGTLEFPIDLTELMAQEAGEIFTAKDF